MASDAQLPQSLLHHYFGTLLVGSWLSTMFLTLEIIQAIKYFRSYKRDIPWIRTLVVSMLFVDAISGCSACAIVYTYLVVGWGDLDAMAKQNATLPAYTSTLGVVALMMHGFLIRRYNRLSAKPLVAAVLVLPAIVAFVGSILVTWAEVALATTVSDRAKQKPLVTLWMGSSAGADILIACALIFELTRVKTTIQDTQSLLRRLIRNTIMSGAITSVLALLALVLFVTNPTSNIGLVFSLSIGHASTVTVLYNLNQRNTYGSVLGDISTSDVEGASIPLDTNLGFSQGRSYNTNSGGISVPQVSVVRYDQSGDAKRATDYERSLKTARIGIHSV